MYNNIIRHSLRSFKRQRAESALFAWPLIYYIADKWLENFYYRIDPGLLTFVAGLVIALGIALLTISFRIMRAASVNPARSLKYE